MDKNQKYRRLLVYHIIIPQDKGIVNSTGDLINLRIRNQHYIPDKSEKKFGPVKVSCFCLYFKISRENSFALNQSD